MIDIHTHILPDVDDGCKGISQSAELLREEKNFGVTAVALTPHLRPETCELSDEEITAAYKNLVENEEIKAIGIKLFLGREIELYRGMTGDFEKGKLLSYNGGKYVLVELKYGGKTDVEELVYNIKLTGYIPVLAHIERFAYARDVGMIQRIKAGGALIQVNAQSLVDRRMKEEHYFAVKLFKRRLIDVVASDVHFGRKNALYDAYLKVKKKDEAYARKIFEEIPAKILNCR